jgi:hypothetical protein
MFDREKVIEILIEDDFFAILDSGDHDYLYNILYGGQKGYTHWTDDELIRECEERDISYLIGDNDD